MRQSHQITYLFILYLILRVFPPMLCAQEAGLEKEGYVVIHSIVFTGNKITRDKIIFRELTFREGDTIPATELDKVFQQSHENLMNTSLFNFVTFEYTPVEGRAHYIDVTIDFLERWYVWPVPILEFADRNFNAWLRKRDWNRLNYGMFLTWNNFRGRREKVVVYSRFGYDEKYILSYQIPYINRNQTLGLGFAGGFSQNHEIAYDSRDNKEVYFKSEEYHPKREIFGYTEIFYRKGIHNFHRGMVAYTDLRIADTIFDINRDYAFGTTGTNRYITLYYQFRSDFRDYKQYPLKGYYFDAEIDKKGVGLFSDPNVNTLYIKSNVRKYFKLKGRFYWASGLSGKISPFWHQPYYYLQGLGYGRDFVRGYEYYVIDAQHYGVLKNNLKFELVPTRVQTFNFIPTDKFNKLYYSFYLNLFADFGYAVDNRNHPSNPLSNQILTGYGIGLDFVTYYDFVLRIEYSFNKMGESGFFIHFMPSI